ncbi:MAG: flavin reductase family protein [Dehalococcoidia bacterium]|nr:flavin reductase family protein [Dehalococcoidia bacterium]
MARRFCDETDSRRLLNPGPVTLVSVAFRDERNAAPVAWAMPLSMEPPLVGVALHPERHTTDMVRAAQEFAINIPGPAMLKQVHFLGSHSGRDVNKLEAASIEWFPGMRVGAPLLDGCLAWIECTVRDSIRFPDHTLFVGEVVRVQALEEAYAGGWLLEDPKYCPLTYLGGDEYAVIQDKREAAIQTTMQGGLVLETAEEREEREEREAQKAEAKGAEGDEGYAEMRRFLGRD